jgi:sugar/nucleoside kinase (ribokinase family)
LLSRAPNIEIEDFPESFINAKAIHMTPIANEFSSQFIEDLANHEFTQDTLIGIDVQGIIRDFDEDNNVIMRSDPEIQKQVFEMLQQFGSRMFFKASDNEARAVTGIDDLVEATEYLGQTGAYIFTTLGSGGLYFKAPEHDTIHINAYEPVQCSDETGAGDCFCAVLLLQLAQLDPSLRDYNAILYATKVASASASFKVQEKGPHGFECRDNIVDRVANGAEIIK